MFFLFQGDIFRFHVKLWGGCTQFHGEFFFEIDLRWVGPSQIFPFPNKKFSFNLTHILLFAILISFLKPQGFDFGMVNIGEFWEETMWEINIWEEPLLTWGMEKLENQQFRA